MVVKFKIKFVLMLFSVKSRTVLFKMFAVLSFFVAVYHLVGVFYKVNDSPVWRHLLFVAINLFCVYGILKRPGYFVYLVALLLVQQYYSHGISLVKMWMEKKQVDWISLLVLLLLPIIFICLVEDHKMKRNESWLIKQE